MRMKYVEGEYFDPLGLQVEAVYNDDIVDTLEAAVWCLLNTNNYKDAVLKAVNLGDDTDTVAAITGGLAGVLYGYEAIPKDWTDLLIKCKDIEEYCLKLSSAYI